MTSTVPGVPDVAEILQDVHHSSLGSPPLPEWVQGFRPWQVTAIEAIVEELRRGVRWVLVDAPTGCLAGDTVIGVNRAGKGFKSPLSEVVAKLNGAGVKTRNPRVRRSTPAWKADIPTYLRQADIENGVVKVARVAEGIESGHKPTYTLTTVDGRTIRATTNHPFATPAGWTELGSLRPGDKVLMDVGRGKKDGRSKPRYHRVQGLKFHPHARLRDIGLWIVPTHRLVAEADLNGVTTSELIARCRTGEVAGLEFLDPDTHTVHHMDKNPLNNDLDNLQVMTHLEHQQHHAQDGGWKSVQFQLDYVEVQSVEFYGVEETYDLTMADDPNFIANGFVVHNSGKTLIAEAVRRLAATDRCLYVATTKSLQEQFLTDYHYAKVLKGRSNYRTLDNYDAFDDRFNPITAADCTMSKEFLPACDGCPDGLNSTAEVMHCRLCHPAVKCPYQVAKREALAAPLAVTNTAYFVSEANGPGQFSKRLSQDGLVIIDEADTLESLLMGQVTVDVSERRAKELNLEPPKRKTVKESWIEWVQGDAIPTIDRALTKAKARQQATPSSKNLKALNYLDRLLTKLDRLHLGLVNEDGAGWVYDGYKANDITFKPVRVDDLADQMLWRHGKQFVLMSATIIDPTEFTESLGIPVDQWSLVTVPAVFPPERQPIHAVPVANMVFKEKAESHPKMADAVLRVLDKHPGERVLVHTVSYDLAQFLFDRLRSTVHGSRLIVYSKSNERDQALDMYKSTPGAVLLAPSMDRGIDLPGDLCLAEGTRILTDRLEWTSIEKIRPGDRVVALDERQPRPGAYRALRYAKVEAALDRPAQCWEIQTTHGSITATAEHPFLVMPGKGRRKVTGWTEVKDMRVGDRIRWIASPVDLDESRGAGWLAGFYDGEGCVGMSRRINGSYAHLDIGVAQRPGPIMERAKQELAVRGFTYRSYVKSDTGVEYLSLTGNLSDRLRFLSTIRPERLVTNLNLDGANGRDQFCAEVLAIKPVGERRVFNLQTSTRTFVAEGFVTHNCRVQVIAKIPFPNLGDKQVNARLYTKGGDLWYRVQTVRSLVQMTGRGMRSADDSVVTYVLDKQFMTNVWSKSRLLLPRWWKDAVRFEGGVL